ncbi:MAG TPA: MATE family efflux transporter [Smithella sp.]|nr:MATE family efflux transporter [Smithella sp.]HOU51803.1 MATE family efflux transporter [Smithella sp.]HQG64270.1 MATE family efflux transporter [Smithella sp.]HQI72094.1 MATE family efflux transporter [Smithella sp.]
MTQRLDLAKEDIFPLILKMSWPSIIAMTAMSLYNFIDTFWMARCSTQALAALTVCFPIQLIASAIGVGTGIGAGSFAARMFGAGKHLHAKKTAGQIFCLSFSFGLFMIVSVLLFGDSIIRLFGASDEIMPLCHDYLYIIVFSSPFGLFTLMANNLLRAEGRPLLSMYVFLIIFVTSMILDPLLIFGLGPFPEMGIRGAATAALVANFSSFIFSLVFLNLRSSKYASGLKYMIPDINIIKSIYATGLPSIMINLVAGLVMVIYNHVLADFGFKAIGAFGICFRIMSMATMVVFGIGAGLMPVVGFSSGAKLHQRLRESVFAALKISFIFASVAFIFLEVFASPLVGLFSNDRDLLAIAITALRIHASALVLIAPTIIFIYALMGLGKGTLAMLLLFFRDSFVFIPLLILLPDCFGITGVWLALPLTNFAALFVVFFWTKKALYVKNLSK